MRVANQSGRLKLVGDGVGVDVEVASQADSPRIRRRSSIAGTSSGCGQSRSTSTVRNQ